MNHRSAAGSPTAVSAIPEPIIIGGAYYSDPDFELEEYLEAVHDESVTMLREVIAGEKARFIYEYDFGDSWRHDLRVEKIRPPIQSTAILRALTTS